MKAMNIEGLVISKEMIKELKAWVIPDVEGDQSLMSTHQRSLDNIQTYLMELWAYRDMDENAARQLLTSLHWVKKQLVTINDVILSVNKNKCDEPD